MPVLGECDAEGEDTDGLWRGVYWGRTIVLLNWGRLGLSLFFVVFSDCHLLDASCVSGAVISTVPKSC